jgi:hypothetical protein
MRREAINMNRRQMLIINAHSSRDKRATAELNIISKNKKIRKEMKSVLTLLFSHVIVAGLL